VPSHRSLRWGRWRGKSGIDWSTGSKRTINLRKKNLSRERGETIAWGVAGFLARGGFSYRTSYKKPLGEKTVVRTKNEKAHWCREKRDPGTTQGPSSRKQGRRENQPGPILTSRLGKRNGRGRKRPEAPFLKIAQGNGGGGRFLLKDRSGGKTAHGTSRPYFGVHRAAISKKKQQNGVKRRKEREKALFRAQETGGKALTCAGREGKCARSGGNYVCPELDDEKETTAKAVYKLTKDCMSPKE